MSAALATEFVRKMVEREGADAEESMSRLEVKYGIGYWTLDHFRRRKAKTCDIALFSRIHAAFIDHCGRQAARLLHEAEMAQAVTPHDDIRTIENEIRALAARLEDAKSKAKASA